MVRVDQLCKHKWSDWTIYDSIPYSAKRWRRKTLANQQKIALAKKTLVNNLLNCKIERSSRNVGRLMQAAAGSINFAN